MLEHFTVQQLQPLLAECHRVLQHGGTLSVAVPNARIYIEGYRSAEAFEAVRYLQFEPAVTNFGRLDIVNYIAYMRGEHR